MKNARKIEKDTSRNSSKNSLLEIRAVKKHHKTDMGFLKNLY